MSKFYDAMARANGNLAEPARPIESTPEAVDQEIHDDSASSESDGQSSSGPVEVPKQQRDDPPFEKREQERSDRRRIRQGPVYTIGVDETPIKPAYERIIQRLITFRKSPRQGVVVVAGAVPGEGASSVARGAALALGRDRTERVVLVDGNLRNPVQHERFGVDLAEGLTDVLRGPVTLSAAVHPDVASGLSLLTAGSPCESPPRLLTSSALQGVVMALTSLFDWVIVDAPPLTQYPEAASIASACGGAMLVIRAEKTRSEVAEEAKKVLVESGVEVVGAVLNRRRFHIPGFIYRRL